MKNPGTKSGIGGQGISFVESSLAPSVNTNTGSPSARIPVSAEGSYGDTSMGS